MYIPTFKMLTIRQVQHFIQEDKYAFSIDLKDAYLHILIVDHHCHFIHLFWQCKPYLWQDFLFGLAVTPRVIII